QRSIRQTLRQTLASCLTAYSKGYAGRAARPRDLACTPHPNSASRRRLSDPTVCKDNGSLNSILLDGCSLYSARRLFTFSWRFIWRSVNHGLGRRKILPSLRLIQKPERRSQRFRKG